MQVAYAILRGMIKSIVLLSLAAILVVVAVEAALLLRLRGDVSAYAKYWKSRPSEGSFTYVALGDSAAQGLGASRPELGYVGLLADRKSVV